MPWNDPNYWMRDPEAKRGLQMIGAAVRRQRMRAGLTQRDLGQMTGIDQSTISRLETGQRCGLKWSRFAVLVATLGGLDFGGRDLARPASRYGLSPNPTVARQQLEVAKAELLAARDWVERRAAEIAATSAS